MYRYVCERKKERTGSRRASGQFENSLASDRLHKVFFVRVPAVTVPFSACFFLPVRSLVPFDLARGRSFLFPSAKSAFGSLVSLSFALACMFLFIALLPTPSAFLTVFLVRTSPLPCGVSGRSSDARSFMSARLLYTPRSRGTVNDIFRA